MAIHIITCPCGVRKEIDGWLNAIEIAALHGRGEGCDPVIDLHLTREVKG